MAIKDRSENNSMKTLLEIKNIMKSIQFNSIVYLVLSALILTTACVEDDNFDLPNIINVEPNIGDGHIIDIDAVIGMLNQSGEAIITIEDTNSYMEGYVISSDEGGNFFEELVLQDKPENPTAGIVVQVDVNPLFTIYDFGRKVYIKLDDLSVAIDNGVVQIGRIQGNQLEKISESNMAERILRTTEVATIVPLEVNISDFSNDLENLFITLNHVQFNRNDVLGDDVLTFAAEDDDEFDGERILESCDESTSVILSTSTFADFKSLRLPKNKGRIQGILTRDFFDEFYTLVINSPEDINFDNTERCDPVEISCGLADTQGTNNLFEDNFESQSTNSLISGNGWTNYIQEGTEGWEAYLSGGTNASLGISARVGSFNSGDATSIAWLISPAINLDTQDNETLVFQTSNSFADGSNIQLLFSDDWDGTEAGILTATWGILTDGYITQDDDFFGDWLDSGIVDLSCASGTIYIAFKYIGSGDSDFDGTFELDNISVDY